MEGENYSPTGCALITVCALTHTYKREKSRPKLKQLIVLTKVTLGIQMRKAKAIIMESLGLNPGLDKN